MDPETRIDAIRSKLTTSIRTEQGKLDRLGRDNEHARYFEGYINGLKHAEKIIDRT